MLHKHEHTNDNHQQRINYKRHTGMLQKTISLTKQPRSTTSSQLIHTES